ncbi:hypothetical protein BDC45DRAFT_529743 [Circinella umbellata]|nr:hypothetical protein BDC45DRAFT_529743 [Circinella umbellata]
MPSPESRKSNDLSDGEGIRITSQQRQHYHQEQPESSASSSSHYQQTTRSEKSDDLAPMSASRQKRHSSTTATTTTESYNEANNNVHYSKGASGFGIHDGQNSATPSIWNRAWHANNSGNSNGKNDCIMTHDGGRLPNNQRQLQNIDTIPQTTQCSNNTDFSDSYLGSLLLIIFIQSVVVIVLEGFRIQQNVFQSSQCLLSSTGVGVSFTNLIYRALVITISLYQLLLCVDTLRQRSTAQLYALILFGFLYVIFAIIQIYQNQAFDEWMIKLNCRNPDESSRKIAPHYEYALLAVIPACFLVFVGCCAWQHRQFTWSNPFVSLSIPNTNFNNNQQKLNEISGTNSNTYSNNSSNNAVNPRVKKAAIALSTLLALIKLDLFFCFSFAAQLSPSAILNYDTTTTESLLVAGIGVVLFIITYYAILNEKIWVLGTMTLLKSISIAYFVFRLITFTQSSSSPSDHDPYRATRYSLIYTLLVLIILITLTSGVAFAAIRGMMHGIKTLQDSSNSTNSQPYNTTTTSTACYYPDHSKDNPLRTFSGPNINKN